MFQSLHMKLIRDDFCLGKANPCTASEQITHIHDNIFDRFSVTKHGEIRIKTFCFSIGQYIYHLFLFRIGQYTLKLLSASAFRMYAHNRFVVLWYLGRMGITS